MLLEGSLACANGTVLTSCHVHDGMAHNMHETKFALTVVCFLHFRPLPSTIGTLHFPGSIGSIGSANDVTNITLCVIQSLMPPCLYPHAFR